MKSRITTDKRPFPGNSLQRFPSLPHEIQNHYRLIVATIENGFAYSSHSRYDAASDSNFLRRKVKRPVCSSRCRYGAVPDSNFLRRKVEQFRLQQSLPLRRRVRFQFSSSQSKTARLQQSLPLRRRARLQFSSSQSRTVPPAAWSWGAGGDRMPRRRHNPK